MYVFTNGTHARLFFKVLSVWRLVSFGRKPRFIFSYYNGYSEFWVG